MKAFEFAHEADPPAELYYNDYSVENAPKRNGVIALIRKLQAAGVPCDGGRLAGPQQDDWPTVAQQDSTISDYRGAGREGEHHGARHRCPSAGDARASAAEMSMNAAPAAGLNPYAAGLPDSVQQALARRYADLFACVLKHRDVIDARDVLGRDRWGFVAERLARARAARAIRCYSIVRGSRSRRSMR